MIEIGKYYQHGLSSDNVVLQVIEDLNKNEYRVVFLFSYGGDGVEILDMKSRANKYMADMKYKEIKDKEIVKRLFGDFNV